MRHSEGWFQGQANIRLYHQGWTPDGDSKAVIILVHGLFEHSGRYAGMAEYFVSRDFAVCSYDHRGHGKSDGLRGYANRFYDFLVDLNIFHSLIRSAFPYKKIFILGHSVGGTIATAYIADHQEDISGLILSAPTIKPGASVTSFDIAVARFLSVLLPKLGISPINSSTISRDINIVQSYRNDPLVYHGKIRARLGAELINTMQKSLPAIMKKIELPTLIMHGTVDDLSNIDGSSYLFESIKSKDKTLKYYEGFYHELFNDPERSQVLSDTERWLAGHL
jgi:alpha-beta hydrolase superfamily lysophospholipase